MLTMGYIMLFSTGRGLCRLAGQLVGLRSGIGTASDRKWPRGLAERASAGEGDQCGSQGSVCLHSGVIAGAIRCSGWRNQLKESDSRICWLENERGVGALKSDWNCNSNLGRVGKADSQGIAIT